MLNPSLLPNADVLISRPYRIIENARLSMAKKMARYFASRNPNDQANDAGDNARRTATSRRRRTSEANREARRSGSPRFGGVGAQAVVETLAERHQAGAHQQQQPSTTRPLPKRKDDQALHPVRQKPSADQKDSQRRRRASVACDRWRSYFARLGRARTVLCGRAISTSAMTR